PEMILRTKLSSLLIHSSVAAGIFSVASLVACAGIAPGPDSRAVVDTSAYTTVLHVDQARGDDIKGDGSSARPLASVIAALEAAGAPAAPQRVAVLVAAGRYLQPTFALKPRVDLFGGFSAAGGGRDILAHPTYLDGGEQNRIAIGANDCRLDGFFLVNGRVRGKGAALLCDGVSPSLINCIFLNNRTLIPAGWNPPLLHETAHDGGAIMCLNGSATLIEKCLFYGNSTECGRGAAVAADRAAAPRILASVFANNRAGLDDPMRSSDGGALSFFDRSCGEMTGNVVVANEALSKNDAGGLFVALWSAPRITDNVIVANEAGDDAGGLFLGGQEHRYDAPLDPYPPADRFNIVVERNLFVGNSNGSRNSGAMRVTMETRARFSHNIIAENAGGFYLQRSEINADHNTIWQEWRFLEDKPSLGTSRFTANIFRSTDKVESPRITFSGNMADASTPGGPHIAVADIFVDDAVDGELAELRFDPVSCTTTLTTREPLAAGNYTGRPVRMGDSRNGGQWRVIASASRNQIVLWGRLDAVTKAPKYFEILRTFTPKPGAPADLGARHN
nr:hypothetical protein [Opitutaceae bacterium]